MDSFKQGNNSETSSEEIDQPERLVNDDNAGTGRSYECTFCKRGFTNAQALGGHMNIHRKDKAKLAKSKHVTSESSISNNFSKDYNNTGCNYFAPILNNQQPYHAAIRAQMNYQTYFPASNPSLFNANSEFSNTGQDYMESNLRLRIGIPYVEENDGVKMERSGDEVDLELRLGHNP